MAIQTSTLTVKGKVGNFVGRTGTGGRYYAGKYQPVVKNPRTEAQTAWRAKFKTVSQFCSSLAGWAKKMCKGLTKNGTAYSNLMFLNPPSTVAVPGQQAGSYVIDFTKVKLSSGSMDLPYNIVANVDGNDIVVNWTDNSGLGNAEKADQCALVCYNAVKGAAVIILDAAKREDSTASIPVPTNWSSETLHAYIAFQRDNGAQTSGSHYLGSFTV